MLRVRLAPFLRQGKAELVPVHTRLTRAREQETLARLCEKLIAGNSMRFAEEFVQAEAGE